MKHGLSLPNKGDYNDIHRLVKLATLAEESGWDGFFLWDHIASGIGPHVDPWIATAAIAAHTSKIRLGLLITPLSRRRPWKVAREIVSLDHLSGGRMVLGAGLGDFREKEFRSFGEVVDPHTRGQMLDEALEIVTGLQSGQRFSYSGSYYQFKETVFNPKPVQLPRVPVWIAGQWPNTPPFRRGAKWDGIVPLARGRAKQNFLTPSEIREIQDYLSRFRSSSEPIDICLSGSLPGVNRSEDTARLAPYVGLGVSWWIEFIYSGSGTVKNNMERIGAGPLQI